VEKDDFDRIVRSLETQGDTLLSLQLALGELLKRHYDDESESGSLDEDELFTEEQKGGEKTSLFSPGDREDLGSQPISSVGLMTESDLNEVVHRVEAYTGSESGKMIVGFSPSFVLNFSDWEEKAVSNAERKTAQRRLRDEEIARHRGVFKRAVALQAADSPGGTPVSRKEAASQRLKLKRDRLEARAKERAEREAAEKARRERQAAEENDRVQRKAAETERRLADSEAQRHLAQTRVDQLSTPRAEPDRSPRKTGTTGIQPAVGTARKTLKRTQPLLNEQDLEDIKEIRNAPEGQICVSLIKAPDGLRLPRIGQARSLTSGAISDYRNLQSDTDNFLGSVVLTAGTLDSLTARTLCACVLGKAVGEYLPIRLEEFGEVRTVTLVSSESPVREVAVHDNTRQRNIFVLVQPESVSGEADLKFRDPMTTLHSKELEISRSHVKGLIAGFWTLGDTKEKKRQKLLCEFFNRVIDYLQGLDHLRDRLSFPEFKQIVMEIAVKNLPLIRSYAWSDELKAAPLRETFMWILERVTPRQFNPLQDLIRWDGRKVEERLTVFLERKQWQMKFWNIGGINCDERLASIAVAMLSIHVNSVQCKSLILSVQEQAGNNYAKLLTLALAKVDSTSFESAFIEDAPTTVHMVDVVEAEQPIQLFFANDIDPWSPPALTDHIFDDCEEAAIAVLYAQHSNLMPRMDPDRCLRCFEKGHRSGECPTSEKDLPFVMARNSQGMLRCFQGRLSIAGEGLRAKGHHRHQVGDVQAARQTLNGISDYARRARQQNNSFRPKSGNDPRAGPPAL
jgi:hypothetical protein